jgi:hypothetical protein
MILVSILNGVMLFAAAAGVAVFWAGWRGRKVRIEPRCRKCACPLADLPEEEHQCPRCHAWLDLPGAIVKETVQRRMRLIIAGSALTLVGGIWLVGAGSVASGRVDVYRYRPQSWLVRDFRAGSDRALAELQRRLTVGSLRDDNINDLVDTIVALQADPNAAWKPSLGDFVERARLAGKVNEGRWKRYLDQALVLEMQLRPRLRRGDPLPVGLSVIQVRTGRAMGLVIDIQPTLLAGPVVAKDRPLKMPFDWPLSLSKCQGQDMLEPGELRLQDIADGRHPVVAEVTVLANLGSVNTKVVKRLDRTCELVAATAPAVELVDDPELTKAIKSRLSVEVWKKHVQITLRTVQVPVNIAFEVSLRDGLDIHRLGTTTFAG